MMVLLIAISLIGLQIFVSGHKFTLSGTIFTIKTKKEVFSSAGSLPIYNDRLSFISSLSHFVYVYNILYLY